MEKINKKNHKHQLDLFASENTLSVQPNQTNEPKVEVENSKDESWGKVVYFTSPHRKELYERILNRTMS